MEAPSPKRVKKCWPSDFCLENRAYLLADKCLKSREGSDFPNHPEEFIREPPIFAPSKVATVPSFFLPQRESCLAAKPDGRISVGRSCSPYGSSTTLTINN